MKGCKTLVSHKRGSQGQSDSDCSAPAVLRKEPEGAQNATGVGVGRKAEPCVSGPYDMQKPDETRVSDYKP